MVITEGLGFEQGISTRLRASRAALTWAAVGSLATPTAHPLPGFAAASPVSPRIGLESEASMIMRGRAMR